MALMRREQIIAEKYPEYSAAFTKVCNRTWAHMFNMFVMRRDLFDQYCSGCSPSWRKLNIASIFPITIHEARIYGFVSEILLDVWIEILILTIKNKTYPLWSPQNWIKRIILERKSL